MNLSTGSAVERFWFYSKRYIRSHGLRERSAAERSGKEIVPPVILGAIGFIELRDLGRGPIPWSLRLHGFATTPNTTAETASS